MDQTVKASAARNICHEESNEAEEHKGVNCGGSAGSGESKSMGPKRKISSQ